jgi:hypothetical protein
MPTILKDEAFNVTVWKPTGLVAAWPKTLPAASRVALRMEREVLNFMTVETVQ